MYKQSVMEDTSNKRIIIVGGGAAGMLAAIKCAEHGNIVTLFEKNEKMGRKLGITGKGRCNVTNDCGLDEFLSNVPTNPRFLYSALSNFGTSDTKEFFESLGVPLKTERGNRVFPVSDRAGDIVYSLVKECRRLGVKEIHEKVTEVTASDGKITGVRAGNRFYASDAVIIATGGLSYPQTGSDGDGYRFSKALGHDIIKARPSLVPLTSESNICPRMQGLSLRNCALGIFDKQKNKYIYEDFGEMMFTHFGLTGPMILSASSRIPEIAKGRYEAHIDLKPALDEKTLDARLLSDFSKNPNKDYVNLLSALLPQKMTDVFASMSGIDAHKKANSITKEERAGIIRLLKCFPVPISGFRPISEAIITKGGVNTKEIDPKTMRSKLVEGLYFAGEVIDVDAYTGGFNLQIAFSTAALAAKSASESDIEQ